MIETERPDRSYELTGTWQENEIFGNYLIRDQKGNTNPTPNLAGRYCSHPWDWFEILSDGRVFMCCATWLPVIVGNLTKESFEEIWNG